MESTSFHAVAPGVSLAAHELVLAEAAHQDEAAQQSAAPGGKSLLVLSALGLCALAYRPLAEAFLKASSSSSSSNADPNPDSSPPAPPPPRYRRVVFLDLRHHGDSSTTAEGDEETTPSFSLAWAKDALWETLAADLEAAAESLDFSSSSPPDVLAHSLGAGVAALACARSPRLFGSLFLFEPPFYPLVAAAAAGEKGSEKKRDLAKDNASFAASAAAASALAFESREDAAGLLEVAPPFKWWHPSCRGAFVEHGLKWRRRRGGESEGEGEDELVFSCGGRALAALASGLMTSSRGAPSRETYRALGGQRRNPTAVTIVSYSAEPRSDVTAFLRAGALAAASAAEAAAAASSSSLSSAAAASPASSVVVLPVRLPEGAKGERSGHYAPLVCPEELGRLAAAAMMMTAKTKEAEEKRSRF